MTVDSGESVGVSERQLEGRGALKGLNATASRDLEGCERLRQLVVATACLA